MVGGETTHTLHSIYSYVLNVVVVRLKNRISIAVVQAGLSKSGLVTFCSPQNVLDVLIFPEQTHRLIIARANP